MLHVDSIHANTLYNFFQVFQLWNQTVCCDVVKHVLFLLHLFQMTTRCIALNGRLEFLALPVADVCHVVEMYNVRANAVCTVQPVCLGIKPSLEISLLRYLIILLPIAFVLSRIIGPAGVWNAFWITEFLTAGVAFLLYRKEVLGRK